jgi:serine/threonine protein kinase
MGWRADTQRVDFSHGTGFGYGDKLAVTKLLNRGVEHRDIRPPNLLWNPEIRNVVLVDFERSEI